MEFKCFHSVPVVSGQRNKKLLTVNVRQKKRNRSEQPAGARTGEGLTIHVPFPLNEAQHSALFLHLQRFQKALRQDPSLKAIPANDMTPRFVKVGDFWFASFGGVEKCIKDLMGMEMLQTLFQFQYRDFSPAELRSGSQSQPSPNAMALHDLSPNDNAAFGEKSQPLIDMEVYGQKLKRLDIDLAEAEKIGHEASINEINREIEQVQAEIAKVGPRIIRKANGETQTIIPKFANQEDRIRKSVDKALRKAIAAITKHHGALGKHLQECVNIGCSCSYTPPKPVHWIFTLEDPVVVEAA